MRNSTELLVAIDGAQHTYMFKAAAQYADMLRKLDGFSRHWVS